MSVQLLTVNEVAARLRYTPRHTRRLIATGALPAVRISESAPWRVREVDLEQFIASWETNEPSYRPPRRLQAVAP